MSENTRVKEFKYGIKLMKWVSFNGNPSYVFAKSRTIRGEIILRLKGYRSHETMFGRILKKDLYKIENRND